MVRFDNIADLLDSLDHKTKLKTKINMTALAEGLFELANEGIEFDYSYTIDEVSLSGNQLYDKMMSDKIKWQTVDDENVT